MKIVLCDKLWEYVIAALEKMGHPCDKYLMNDNLKFDLIAWYFGQLSTALFLVGFLENETKTEKGKLRLLIFDR